MPLLLIGAKSKAPAASKSVLEHWPRPRSLLAIGSNDVPAMDFDAPMRWQLAFTDLLEKNLCFAWLARAHVRVREKCNFTRRLSWGIDWSAPSQLTDKVM